MEYLKTVSLKEYVKTLSMNDLAHIITKYRRKPTHLLLGAQDILRTHAYTEWDRRYGNRSVPEVILDEDFIF